MKLQIKQCAIYTRKSTEEGLEQEFNTLDAQRESCLAYIMSQKSEGWCALKEHYDDGGYSGGNIERPALKRLIDDIKAGKINIVVVYKIDRLTRSLADFSKLVEVFDQYGVTFVSVTQSFNTTTSMGRLTLNVLLSFAQFEREVIGERVRDKVSASKKKGMWMGGNIPSGYILENRQIKPDPKDAEKVRYIFNRYLELGSVESLMEDLKNKGVGTKLRTSKRGKGIGGNPYSRGALYHLLRNPVFIGKTKHKDKIYDGLHEPIIAHDIWNQVQTKLAEQSVSSRGLKKTKSEGYLLKGKIFDASGNRYSPCFTNKNGVRYTYYVSQAVVQFKSVPVDNLARLPAYEFEVAVEKAVRKHLPEVEISSESLFSAITSVVVKRGSMEIYISLHSMEADVPDMITAPFMIKRARNGAVVIQSTQQEEKTNDPLNLPPEELERLVQGIVWRDEHFSGLSISQIANREEVSDTFIGKLIHQSFI